MFWYKNVVVASSDAEIYSVVQGDMKNNKQALPKKKKKKKKRQVLAALKAASDIFGTFLGTFTAYKILELRRKMGMYLHKFNLLAFLTTR